MPPLLIELLGIPLRKTSRVDLCDKLTSILQNTAYQNPSIFKDDLELIGELRDSIGDTTVTLDSLISQVKYYFYLNQLDKKFPDDHINFKWQEVSFKDKKEYNQSTWRWEKLNVLYNIAATCSQIALDPEISQNVTSQCKYFQMSGIVLDHLVQNVADLPGFELNTLSTLKALMLAQGMECFWIKAVTDGLKDSIVGKLSSQCLEYYKAAAKYSTSKGSVITKEWIGHINSKIAYFETATLWRMASDFNTKGEYGLQVKCLLTGRELIRKCHFDVKYFQEKLEEAFKDAERDNNYIYNQVVPEAIPDLLPPLNMIKMLPMDDILFKHVGIDIQNERQLFDTLLPVDVIEATTAFKLRQDEYVEQHLIIPINALTKILNQHTKSKTELSESIKPLPVEELQSCERSMEQLHENGINIGKLIDKAESTLNDEIAMDKELRSKHGSIRWTLPNFDEVSTPFKEKIATFKTYLEQGTKVDKENADLFNTIDKRLITSEINIPKSNNPLIKQYDKVLSDRQRFLKDINEKCWKHSVLPTIISHYRETKTLDFESLFQKHLEFFNNDLKFLEEQKRINSDLIEQFEKSYKKTEDLQRLEPAEVYILDFKHSMSLLEEVKENIKDGSKFYTDLINAINQFMIELQNFIESRKISSKQLDDELMIKE